MSHVALSRPSKTVAVTVIGLITLLPGGYCTAFGGWAIFAGEDWLGHPSKDPWMQAFALGGIVPALLIVFGVAFLILGILGLLAGVGVLLRKQWGRILTFIMAARAAKSKGLDHSRDFRALFWTRSTLAEAATSSRLV